MSTVKENQKAGNQAAWEAQQEITKLRYQRDGLATENTKLRQERDDAIRAGYMDQEEAITLHHQHEADVAQINELRKALELADLGMEELQTNTDTVQARHIEQERELLGLREKVSMLTSSNDAALQNVQHLERENEKLHEQITTMAGVREERDGLREQNTHLLGGIKLLKSQIGNFLVDSGKIGKTYYALEAMSNIPFLGQIIRQASAKVYDAYQKHKR